MSKFKILWNLMLLSTAALHYVENAFSWELTFEQKKADLIQLRDMIKSHYAPLELKGVKYQLSIDQLYQEYENKILETKSNADFYYKMVEFVAEFKDGHFSIRVPTNHVALMPFSVEYVNGKVLVAQIIRDLLPIEKFPFEKGDEVVGIDDMSIEEYIKKYSVYENQGNELSKRALTAATLTRRSGQNMPTPGKKSTVFIKKKDETNAWGGKVSWIHLGDPMDEFDYNNIFKKELLSTSELLKSLDDSNKSDLEINYVEEKDKTKLLLDKYPQLQHFLYPAQAKAFFNKSQGSSFVSNFNLKMNNDYLTKMNDYHCSGETRIKIPLDATIIMEEPFVAYYHPTDIGNIGYLRIPHYSFDDNDLAFMQYEYAIAQLEANTVGLVIDQDHNCGGSINFLHQMLSLFMDKPFVPTPFSFLVNKVQVLQFKSYAKQLPPNTLFSRDFNRVKDLIYNAWIAKQKFTPLTPFFGNDRVYPNHIHYTKPIVMLIDYMSGSGGDAFPTMMQAFSRATLIGTQTMGLGGHVESMPELNNSGMNIHMTRSLFFSPKGVAVENNGARPDVPYVITQEDFLDEYTPYQEFYIKVLTELIEKQGGVVPMNIES